MVNSRSFLEMRALRYLAQREYSRLELEQKLFTHACLSPPEALSDVLDKLEQKGFLSADRVVEQVIRTRRPRFGSQRIVYELKEKGIDEQLIHEALPALKETELEVAFKIWQKKFGQPPSTREERGKQMRFMMSRGFSMEIIQQVLSQADEENR
ncbi:recombination regulator RecX [Nitrosomonas sp. Nm166]|uniref:recombination regulator RecX n=1 Tax=Nitrosomonas sp. Nm166 TaxID=1881054 RepID=UPI0008EDFABE|nr:recombination regulator RecX [Nitrosomonas sp. Nm166]SFD86748.1 regulatory protein [Nitrosomonas sp. Nm166]